MNNNHSLPPPRRPGGAEQDFHLFRLLPRPIRIRIWWLAAPIPRTRYLEVYEYHPFHKTVRIRYIPPLPPLFQVCQESRRFSIRYEGGQVISFLTKPRTMHFYFNFRRDIFFLSSRFTRPISSPDTYRLIHLAGLMPIFYLKLVKRIGVTYSGWDRYQSTGAMLRKFEKLDRLYIVMMDWWTPRDIKRKLKKGIPPPGLVKAFIEANIRVEIAAERGPELETEEERNNRIQAGGRTKIKECELHLDEDEPDEDSEY